MNECGQRDGGGSGSGDDRTNKRCSNRASSPSVCVGLNVPERARARAVLPCCRATWSIACVAKLIHVEGGGIRSLKLSRRGSSNKVLRRTSAPTPSPLTNAFGNPTSFLSATQISRSLYSVATSVRDERWMDGSTDVTALRPLFRRPHRLSAIFPMKNGETTRTEQMAPKLDFDERRRK